MEVQTAPQFTLEHIEGHSVSLNDFRGRPVVVAISGKDTADQIAQGIETLRNQYSHDQLPVLAVADLGGVPRPARILAKKQLKGNYADAVEKATAHQQATGQPARPASEHVILLADWSGDVASGFGVGDVNKEAAMILVDGEGRVRGVARGPQCAQQILAMFG